MPSSFDGLSFDSFTVIYNFILIHDLRELATNPIMRAIVEYGVSLAVYTKEKAWWPEFLKVTVAARLGLLMSWYETETPVFDAKLVDTESIDKVEKETAKLLTNIKGDRPWMTALKQKSKEIKALKVFKSPQSGSTEVDQLGGSQTDSFPAETKTLPAAVEF